jgi:hypothetical protein
MDKKDTIFSNLGVLERKLKWDFFEKK